MYEFNYHRPTTMDEARALFESAEDGRYLAGGHSLLPSMKLRLNAPTDLIDLSGIDAMRSISVSGGTVVIGSLVTHDEVARSSEIGSAIPALSYLASCIGDAQVRNRGTIGGSLANNDPAADYPAATLGLGATIVTDQREIPADDYFEGMFETCLHEAELIQSISFPIPESAAYEKFPNPASRYAIVGAFVARTSAGVRVAITGAASCVFRATEMESALSNDFSASALDGITIDVDEMNEDLHASPAYRAHLCRIMAQRAAGSIS
jgi:carbon-monoxide dehydrogenase medium subunit